MCGSLRDVRKKACFLVRDKTLCAQIYCKNDVADYKKEIHGYKKWELFSILFIIPYLCRVFHADTSVREVWESGKYIYIEKTFTWRFCSWHFETSQISNPATNKATVGVCAIC